jgi:DNA-binding transcriptional ArsR family regulator
MAKNSCPDGAIISLAEKLKVCGHPVRLKILCLIEKQDSCVTELWQCLDQSQPVISQHLAILKDRGIVESDVQGNRRIYSVCDPFIKDMVQSFPFLTEVGSDTAVAAE